ncbi:hypothetical protein [Lysinibacillus telephonicus]|uniref:hypothetical protein n=1 Tax=Lysinibacillus telephonicus TaxID=1714840 RepID=UPI003BA26E7C
MIEDIKSIIENMKKCLKEDPSSIVFGELNDGIGEINEAAILKLGKYYDFLSLTNGARCGDIDFWSYNDLEKNQYVLSDIQDERESWLSIGQILYEPLLINKFDGIVYEFIVDDGSMNSFGELEFFLKNYVFGPSYCKVIPNSENDDWFLFLKKNGRISN